MSNIISVDASNRRIKLILNETFSLIRRDSIVEIDIPIQANPLWRLIVNFTNNPNIVPLNGEISVRGNDINLVLNQWFSDSWVESSDPYIFNSVDNNIRLSIVIRTTANAINNNFRLVIVSIWKVI